MTRDGFNVSGLVSGIVKRIPKPPNGRVQASVEIYERAFGPQFGPQALAGDQLTGAFQKHSEDLERLVLNLESNSMLAEFERV